jgi:hypothetical protein
MVDKRSKIAMSRADCPCFTDISARIQIPWLVRIVQEYAHNEYTLADHGLNDFELHVRHAKYRGRSWVSTSGAWMQDSIPREIPYAEARITPWDEVYNAHGVQVKGATHLKLEFIYRESIARTYASVGRVIKIATKEDRVHLIETLFAADGYDELMASIKWRKQAGWIVSSGKPGISSLTGEKIAELTGEQFREVCAEMRAALEMIEMKHLHMCLPILLCYTR